MYNLQSFSLLAPKTKKKSQKETKKIKKKQQNKQIKVTVHSKLCFRHSLKRASIGPILGLFWRHPPRTVQPLPKVHIRMYFLALSFIS
jgi:hypothetical protein